ncbi:type II secretion system protein GspL [Aliikangiella sp. G2MR2-5]|uniref:type II secretion system protein GspL n=1 Tax=Aliikangiella sp. G2MR2-5 TaxID=2788943 RepID=UPI0018AA7606|nr:type II secretion system protein GspL [Aliikangiella sp. G2MR2-5]
MKKLTIFWGDKNSDSFYWLSEGESNSGGAISQLESHEILKDDLNCLAEMAEGAQVSLIISSNDVHYNAVSIPGKAQRHLRKAVPYLLEEQVAEAVDDLFIALGGKNSKDQIEVRAINSAYFASLIKRFKNAEISISRIIIDLDTLPASEDCMQAVLLNEDVLVVAQSGERWRCTASDFSWIVQKQLQALESEEEMPVAIPLEVICENEDDYMLFEQVLPAGRFAPNLNLVESVKQFLSEQQHKSINLLQGEFEPKKENTPLKKFLIKISSVAAVVLCAQIVWAGSQWFSLSAKSEQLERQKEVMWKQVFPGRKMPKTADKQIRAKMRELAGGQGDNAFVQMLDSVTSQIKSFSELYPTNVSYDAARNELRLDLIGKEYATLNNYRDQLIQAGFQVDMNSASQRGEGYSSRFIVKK